jgi:putative ABC transport system ATP-binding protein
MSEAVIEARDLVREFPMGATRVRALRGVSLTIRSGEFVALMGSSGSGKSTLLHILGCLDTPSAGNYRLEGRDVSKLSRREQNLIRNTRLGFVFQNFFLISSLSAYDNVALPLLYRRKSPGLDGQVRAALAQVGLSERSRHRPMELSGGERQRVAIARALVIQPALLLADEPTGNLDSATGTEVMSIFGGLWKQGMTILLVTHDPAVAAHAERVIHMRDGQILKDERKADAISSFQGGVS